MLTASCTAFFQDLKQRGLADPLLVVTDGAPGLIRAVETCFPRALRQRCLVHRLRNLRSKAPESLWAEIAARARGCYIAASPTLATMLRDDFVAAYERELPAVVQCFQDDFDACIAHLRFPLRICGRDPRGRSLAWNPGRRVRAASAPRDPRRTEPLACSACCASRHANDVGGRPETTEMSSRRVEVIAAVASGSTISSGRLSRYFPCASRRDITVAQRPQREVLVRTLWLQWRESRNERRSRGG
jgi:hypothetical protein